MSKKRVLIYPYSMKSEGAKLLAEEMDVYRATGKGNYANAVLINWGNVPRKNCRKIINAHADRAVNKLRFFDRMRNALEPPRIPAYTSSRQVAQGWLQGGHSVVVRAVLDGSRGEGISIIEPSPGASIPAAPLYTKYSPKSGEYRVHIVGGRVIHLQKKVKERGSATHQVRNAANGYFYTSNCSDVPSDVATQALKAFKALGVDFAAFDVIYSKRTQQATVLEANTAPGIEGITVTKYAKALKDLANK